MKRYLVISLLLFIAAFLVARPISTDQALRVAENWMLERTGTSFTNSTVAPLEEGSNLIYVVSLRPTGYALIAGDDASYPVLGFNSNHAWGEYELPPQLEYLIGVWLDQLRDMTARNLSAGLETAVLWSKYDRLPGQFVPARDLRDVSPLMSTIWGQGTYYNAQCPSGTPVGCVATAMAQIMRYWSFPPVGSGSHSYNCPPYGTQSADFGATAYNWAAMPNNVTSANAAVATISRHAGVAVDMQYAPSGSGAYSTDVPNALTTYFKYASSTQYRSKSSYTASVWEAMMKGEIDNARPVYYSGYSTGSGGHAWVLDGYSGSNFHVNWGWNGYYNGYYSLTALNPGTDNFSSGQAAVVGIAPTSTLPTLSEGFEGATFPPTGWAVTASSFARSTTNAISGTYSARYNQTATGATQSGKQLITPQLVINSTCPSLTFKARAGTTARSEQLRVGYSTSQSGPWTYFGTNASLTTTAQTFTYVVNTLPEGNYYFVLETYCTLTNSASRTWIIDDVAGPYREVPTQASINMTSWAAGSLAPGDQARSGNIFTLANVGTGTLTVTSVTNLSGTDFATNFNSGISLVYGQTHDFGFTYDPLDYGTDNVNFQIVTNGGTVTVALSGGATYAVFSDGFENYADFALSFPPWTQYDGDGYTTYSITGVTFPNQGYTGSYIIFNPSAATPSQAGTALDAHLGMKGAYCLAGTSAPNNDWLISPLLNMGGNGTLSFWAKSYTSTYGLERFKVLYSTTTNTYSAFTNYLAGSATTYVEAPTTWTNYSYALPSTARYFAIQCVSNDAFVFMVDDVAVSDGTTPPPPTFGNLSGYVYQYGTTTPIGNAVITVGTKQAITNSFGFYQINNILTGTVSASCTAPGMFYHPSSASGIVITAGGTTTMDFNLTWGEIAANPTSVSMSLYQGETGNSSVTLTNPGGTAPTLYAGYFTSAARNQQEAAPFVRDRRKPATAKHGTSIDPITDAPAPDRAPRWFSYATIGEANYYSGAQTERGNYFLLSDFALMDGAVTISQLRGYFYNPSTAAWTTTTHRTFAWKIYSVSPEGSVSLLHTSANILLPSIATGTYTLNEYTLPAAVTIPAGYDFIVTAKPSASTDTSGRPQSLATDVTSDNGLLYDATNGWQFTGLNYLVDAYADGTEWLTSYNFSGSINPGGSAVLPLNFNTVGVTAGTKNAYMYIYNDANYTAPSPRGDVLVVPVSLTVTVATEPVAVLTGETSWTTRAEVGTPSTSGNIFQIKNVGPGNLTVTSISGLAGTPFTTNFNTGISLPQNGTHDFGFTFAPTQTGIWETTFTIVTNGGTKTINLKGYGNYIFESFEGAIFPPDGWLAVDYDADTYNWFQYNAVGAPHSGDYCAASASWVSGTRDGIRPILYPDNWLITPRLAVPTGGIMSFWIAAQDPAYPYEHYSVKLSTTNNQVASFTVTLHSETLSSGDWLYREIDLSAWAGENVFIAFQHHDCFDQFYLKLDDIYLPPLAAPLVYGNITGRVSKAGTSDYLAGVTVSLAGRSFVTLEDGNYTINNIVVDTHPITASAAGYVPYSNEVTLLPNQTLTHNIALDYAQFSTPATLFNLSVVTGESTSTGVNLANVGTAAVNWTADSGIWGGDAFPAGPFLEDFEDLEMLGWTGYVGPYSDIYTGYGFNSQNVWVFASQGITEPQYIISPKLRIAAGDNLSFMCKQFNPSDETFEVRISTTDNAIGSFQTLATVGPLTSQDWTSFNFALDSYAGSDIYLCFYYPRVDGYQYGYILLDDIAAGTAILPPTEWLSSTPSGSLNPGQSAPFNLYVDASTLPVGNYTAQTWIFGSALNSPYKLYVNLSVTPPLSVDPPENIVQAVYDTHVEFGWDPVDNAYGYHVYGSVDPYSGYSPLLFTEDTYAEFSWAQLAALGLVGDRGFFRVTADTSAPRSKTTNLSAKANASRPLDRMSMPGRSKTLNQMK